MTFGSTAGFRASRALRTSAARWSGRTSASDPFTLPMGVRQASTTNTELTLTYLRREAYHVTISHGAAAQDVLGRRTVRGLSFWRLTSGVEPRVRRHAPAGVCHLNRRGLCACVPMVRPANGFTCVVAAPVALCWVRL